MYDTSLWTVEENGEKIKGIAFSSTLQRASKKLYRKKVVRHLENNFTTG
jgi:hypothetical protein